MAPRGLCPLLLLSCVLLGACLAQFIPYPGSYQRFLREHVDFPRTFPPKGQRYCPFVMRRLGSDCRRFNTFIHAPQYQVRNICRRGGICHSKGNVCDSRSAFQLTTCQTLTGQQTWPQQCTYRERRQRRRIRVACNRQRDPVRLVRLL
ncbi:ribonuclease-like [Carettochelys insculpta]|uniref:ribonuclease-like n=1 Tax=Carettochelys insculpta TaxID=44489 RepID=UPI003EBEB518